MPSLPRLRQAVIASRDLERTARRLRRTLGLGEPYRDPGVEYFGLRNAVFTLGDTFLEVVSPMRPGTPVERLLDRRGDDVGYMLMFQVEDLEGARERARLAGVRKVFEVSLEDISEVHLHPADMRAAIVSLSQPRPPESWRWGGPDWTARAVPLDVVGATISVAQPRRVAELWRTVLGAELSQVGLHVSDSSTDDGLTEVILSAKAGEDGLAPREPIDLGRVRFALTRS